MTILNIFLPLLSVPAGSSLGLTQYSELFLLFIQLVASAHENPMLLKRTTE